MHHSKITLNFHHSNGAVRLRFLPLAFGCANTGMKAGMMMEAELLPY